MDFALGDMPSYSAYYKREAGINRRGPRVLERHPGLSPLSHLEALACLQKDADALPWATRLATICAAGFRAGTAASILRREGFSDGVQLLGSTNA